MLLRRAAVFSAACASVALIGCGMPGAPQPPSLNLPARVSNLSTVRAGDQVSLAWSMPTRNTDKTLIAANVTVRICRNPPSVVTCAAIARLQLAPGADGSYTDALPPDLSSGSPRLLTYFVELANSKGKSAGLSNAAPILAGATPPPIAGLTAAMHPDGVLLSWTPTVSGSPATPVRLVRRLLTPPAKQSSQGPLAPPPEPLEQNLLVQPGSVPGRALDTHIRFGESYEYRAQRVARLSVSGQTLELASSLSSPVRIDAENIFPPAVPTGLVAAATPAANGEPPAIDLSWLPVGSADLAGYIVYRRDITQTEAAASWLRISPSQPVVGPAYHDAAVQPGRVYQYTVSSIGQNERESARSDLAQETVPAQ